MHYSCLVCQDPRERNPSNCRNHEKTQTHQQNLLIFQSEPLRTTPVSESSQPLPTTVNQAVQEDALRALIRSITATPDQPPYPLDFPELLSPTGDDAPTLTGLQWNLDESLVLDDDPWKDAASRVAQATLDFLNGDLSGDEDDERSDASEGPHTAPGPDTAGAICLIFTLIYELNHSRQRH